MNAHDRLLRVLKGQPCDETPIWLLYPYHRLGCYVDVRELAAYAPVQRAAEQHCITLDRRGAGVPLFAPEVEERREDVLEGDLRIHRRTVTWRGRSLVEEHRQSPRGASRKPLLVEDEDLEFFLDLPLNDDPKQIRASLNEHLPRLRAEAQDFPRDLGATMFDLGEPIGALYGNSDLESFSCWSLSHDAEIVAWLERRMQACREIYRWSLEQRIAEVYFLVGSELAAPPLVGLECFQRWIVPYASELISMVKEAGCFAIQHFHGQIRRLLPWFKQMAPHALHTIEAPPIGDCTISQAYDVLGTDIALIGNVQYDDFRSSTPEQMRAQVHALLDEVAGRPFICSPSAGPFDPNPSPRLIENYLAFIDAARSHGKLAVPC